MLHTHVIYCDCVEFRDEILLRGEECKTRENFNFLKKGKMVISAKNPKFLEISNDETDFTVGIVSRNLVSASNLVKFRDILNFTFFEAMRVTGDMW